MTPLSPVNHGLVPTVDIDDVKAGISFFSKHSGCGPSGLRPWHLKQALTPAHIEEVLEQLTGLVALLVQGRAPRDVAKWLCGATLLAMPKKDGGVWPIAVGDVLRRLAAKVLCATYKDDVTNHLWPLQIGVGRGKTNGCCNWFPDSQTVDGP